jgi:hypothetical protein
LDITFCYEKCQRGKEASEKSLAIHDSVFAAAFYFNCFVETCFKTCPYVQEHIKNEDKES